MPEDIRPLLDRFDRFENGPFRETRDSIKELSQELPKIHELLVLSDARISANTKALENLAGRFDRLPCSTYQQKILLIEERICSHNKSWGKVVDIVWKVIEALAIGIILYLLRQMANGSIPIA